MGLSQSAEYQRQANYQAAQYAKYTHDHVGRACVAMSALDKDNCLAEASEKRRTYERNEQDLVAQRQSALWAYIMGAAAVVGVGLSAVGVWLVWTTFAETREANVIARASAESQIRPWLKINAIPRYGFRYASDDNGESFEYTTVITIKNLGQSPAIDASYLTTFLFIDPTPRQLKAAVESWFSGPSDDWRDKNIFPDETWERNSGAVHTGNPPGKGPVNLVSCVRYRTALSDVWRFSVRVYSLGYHDGEGFSMSINEMSDPSGFGKANFQEHQRCAGIAT